MNIGVTVGGYVAAIILFWLFISAREDLATEIERCNTDKISSALVAEQLVRQATESAYNERIAELESMALNGQKAVDSANAARIEAITASSNQAITINQLMRDADVSEIPDSTECLNVFVPASAVDGMRGSGNDCRSSDFSRSGDNQICADSSVIAETDFPSGDFAEVTFGESLVLWEMDRSTIRSQNAQFEAIGTLRDGE